MKAESSALFAMKQFIRPSRSKDNDRGSEWVGGECDGFRGGAEGASNIGVDEDGDDVLAAIRRRR